MKLMQRAGKIMLGLCMLLSVLAIVPISNLSADTRTATNRTMVLASNGLDYLKPTSTSGGSSSWEGSYLYYGATSNPIKWLILNPTEMEYCSQETMLLFSDNGQFGSTVSSDTSPIEDRLSPFITDKYDAIDSREKKYFVNASYPSGVIYEDDTVIFSDTGSSGKFCLPPYTILTNSKYGFPIKSGGGYWLNVSVKENDGNGNFFTEPYYQGVIRSGGVVSGNVLHSEDVRAVSNIDPTSFLFLSGATGVKTGTFGFTAISDNTNNEYKVTIKDPNQSIAISNTSISKENVLSFDYSLSGTSIRNRISAIITDENNDILHYGQVKAVTASGNETGSASITLPDDFDYAKHTIQVFSEEYNGDKKTDYASELVTVTVASNTVTFDTNGGSAVAPIVSFGATVDKPTDPTKAGATFRGWYSDNKLTKEYDFNTVVSKDITLYAKWETTLYEDSGNLGYVVFDTPQDSRLEVTIETVDLAEVATKRKDLKAVYDIKGSIEGEAVDLSNKPMTIEIALSSELKAYQYHEIINVKATNSIATMADNSDTVSFRNTYEYYGLLAWNDEDVVNPGENTKPEMKPEGGNTGSTDTPELGSSNQEKTSTDVEENTRVATPNTNDTSSMTVYVLVGSVSLIGVYFIFKTKRKM